MAMHLSAVSMARQQPPFMSLQISILYKYINYHVLLTMAARFTGESIRSHGRTSTALQFSIGTVVLESSLTRCK